MTTLRLPQPGEKWRVRIRTQDGDECSSCGHMPSPSSSKFEGKVVTIVGPASPFSICGECHYRSPTPEGYIQITERGSSGFRIALPYAWLEPLDWEQP